MYKNVIYCGDCLDILKTLPSESANCCVTSPPYYGLRDYGVDGQIGCEDTPQKYVEKLTEIFGEVFRVLKDDGTLWLNLADSYAGSGKGRNADGRACTGSSISRDINAKFGGRLYKSSTAAAKPKDLLGIPWTVALALRDSGWYLRQDIIWAKGNPMPESVKDRCTKSHEYIFLFSKSKKYYFDNNAIREDAVSLDDMKRRANNGHGKWKTKKAAGTYAVSGKNRSREELYSKDGKRNKRDVWFVNTKPCREAHFATFPDTLIEPCVLAGCPDGGIVIDPFLGSGTTAFVSLRNNRNYVGIEINPEFIEIAERRIKKYACK